MFLLVVLIAVSLLLIMGYMKNNNKKIKLINLIFTRFRNIDHI